MTLCEYVNTFGQMMLNRYHERVHKLAIDAGFTCPNRDGTLGRGGCTFCNNVSFSPNGRQPDPVNAQLESGRRVLAKRTGAKKFLAYFQAYTNTYDDVAVLKQRYDTALSQPDVIGLAIGTRPDCAPEKVLDLLQDYHDQGYEIWLELGLQSAFDHSLQRVNRGHGFAEYQTAVRAARQRGLPVCTHLILGLPGEDPEHARLSLHRVLEEGVDGLKLHPLHVVKGTLLANQWRRDEYRPWSLQTYIGTVADLVEMTPVEIVYHRLTGTAASHILLAPEWCNWKWKVLNGIEQELARRGTRQGQHSPQVALP
ncbi:TIGR01212 family radical SAM protein [Thiohalophilus sp.]|uniref:TIGR01212 family radical SAM protein n=1 Tax=Thiohalophilus sp. TaxID=3028392 RepID=UPI002ACEBA3C|nr:TIGR01212 family radical SAM protein [Thiohalophilus sp.]MDZ7661338.1 TIGR01212 family radical SAM protein [Thiohalophilus sp.]MDZ7803093.1 TIGR01212 family radical SAM protein [Thiohalophilus sp.]